MHQFDRSLCCGLQSANDHTSHLQDVTTVELAIEQFYYRAMHFSAKRGIAIACRLSVCL